MKFPVDIKTYEGSDLIIMIGCPGSRWSHVHRVLSENPAINNTDWSEVKSWTSLGYDTGGNLKNMGNHRGSYWGPDNYYGKKFDRLDALTKEEILSEFMEAFETWDGYKIIKSHWFAYNIEYIHNLFPKASIVSCYAGDIESFFWWHKCGGWGLGYANYAWYENDVKLLEKIKEENTNILKFSTDRNLKFRIIRRSELWNLLGIPYESPEDPNVKCKVTVYRGGFISSFDHLKASDSHFLRRYGVIEDELKV